jgi:AcrR family transcriptional regulator
MRRSLLVAERIILFRMMTRDRGAHIGRMERASGAHPLPIALEPLLERNDLFRYGERVKPRQQTRSASGRAAGTAGAATESAAAPDVAERDVRPLSGRRAQAARNDQRILEAAREVFLADPGAPISAVADRAGVGIGALYRRHASKDELLQRLAADGMARYLTEVRAALADEGDPWIAFTRFMRRCVDIGAGALTQRLAGSFTSTEELQRQGREIYAATQELLDRTKKAAALRADVEVGDLSLLLEQLQGIRIGDEVRASQLRHRYLAVILDGLHLADAPQLPSTPPTWQETSRRYDG